MAIIVTGEANSSILNQSPQTLCDKNGVAIEGKHPIMFALREQLEAIPD
jgi:hypothetical protein